MDIKHYNGELLNAVPALFAAVWDNCLDGMIILDDNEIISLVNKVFCTISGKTKGELEGKNYDTIFSLEFRNSPGYEIIKQTLKKTPSAIKEEIVLSDNRKIWVKIITANISGGHMSPLVLQIFRDITEFMYVKHTLEAEKEELNVILRNIGDGIISTNREDNIIFINNAVEELLGWNQEELYGKSIIELFELLQTNYNVYAGKINYSSLFGTYSENQTLLSETLEVISKQGTKKILLCSSAEILKNKGELSGYIYVLKDITEQVKTETQLLLSQKMESIGQLAAGIAHEINSPMQFINDNIVFLQDAFNSLKKYMNSFDCSKEEFSLDFQKKFNDQKRNLDIDFLINEIPQAIAQSRLGIERVTKLITAMKDFAHPGVNEKIYSDINHGIEVTSVISRNEWKYIAELELNLDSSLPLVYCNVDEINQVVLNMIVNAAQAIAEKTESFPDEKGRITISSNKNQNCIEIKICDNGTGISEENMARIFDPFFTTKDVGKGTGQGLAIAHNIIVNNHKGLINVDSVLGLGSTFTIQVPINASE